MRNRRRIGTPGLARFAIIAALIIGNGPVVSTAAARAQQSDAGSRITPGELAKIRTDSDRIVGELENMSETARKSVLTGYVLNAFAEAADIPGADTNQLTPPERKQAQELVDQLLGGDPPPIPTPSPAPSPPSPSPSPTPSPAPRPSSTTITVVIVQPVPVNYIYPTPASSYLLVPTQGVAQAQSRFNPLMFTLHNRMHAFPATYLLVPR
jgi:hypothetical protein